MSDAPHRPQPEDTPSAEELERNSVPASIRRAPRFGRIVGTGAGAGFAIGFLCGMILPNSTGVGRGMVGLLVGLGFGLLTGMVAGLVAVGIDRRSPAHLKATKEREAARASAADAPEPEERP